MKKRFLKYGITGGICLGLAAVYGILRNVTALPPVEKYRTLCDAFTIPGLLSFCVGGLLWVWGDGFFAGLLYCLHMAWSALLPGGRQRVERYPDYRERHRQKKITDFSFLFVWGGVCMAIAVIFLVCFYRN